MCSVIMQVYQYPKHITNYLHNLNNKHSSAVVLLRCAASSTTPRLRPQTGRRSGGYHPALWDFDSIQSLNTTHSKEERDLITSAQALIEEVRKMLVQEAVVDDDVRWLELIDDLHRLGISCHFENQIIQILNSTYLVYKYGTEQRDLYSTSLRFRLLRQYGFNISQEVFDCFKNEKGDFKASLGEDIKGLLQLYEASFLLTQGEDTLELARKFSTSILQRAVDHDHQIDDHDNLLSSIRAAMEFPSHWRVQMPNARSFIDAYERRPDMNPIVLELAKLDINIVQAQFQQELKEASRWWENMCLVQQLPFVRDRIVECYFWTTGVIQRREHGYERIMLTKINALVTTIDDVFDIYGTLQELQLFTTTIQRWDDIESIEKLPPYMQLCYLALHNFVHEMAYDTLKDKGFNSIPYLRKTWGDLVEAYIKEAEWYYNGHKPSMEEYINNAWISIGGVPILSHIYFWLTDSIEREAVEKMHKYHDIVRASCTILRLANDMGTSLEEVERGDVPKSIQCCMNEKNCGEEEAREHVRSVMKEAWKTMNTEMMMMMSHDSDPLFSKHYVEAVANLARTAQFIYQDGSDGFGMQHPTVNKLLAALLFQRHA